MKNKNFFGVLFILFFVAVFTIIVIKDIELKQKCIGYIQQAANANTVELASERLAYAISYAERNHLTDGYTSILYKTEDENVGFWYQNLKACQTELEKAKKSTSQLEKTNLLMKVRESLTDSNGDGSYVLYPTGLSRYPHNIFWGIMQWLAAISFAVGLILLLYDDLCSLCGGLILMSSHSEIKRGGMSLTLFLLKILFNRFVFYFSIVE